MDAPDQEVMDYNRDVTFPDSDEEDGTGLVEVSETTRKFLQTKFTQSVANDRRRRTKGRFPHPKVEAVRTPKLDDFLKQEISQTTKSADKEMAKIQTFVLDAVAPLTALLETEASEEDPSKEKVLAQPWAMQMPEFHA